MDLLKESDTRRLRSSPAIPGSDSATTGRSNLLGKLVQSMIDQFDGSKLGVKVSIDTLNVDAARGTVEVLGLTVPNPSKYHSPYLLHADKVLIDIDMQKLILSFGGHIDVEELVFQGVDVIYEKSLTTSNVKDILANLSGGKQGKQDVKGRDGGGGNGDAGGGGKHKTEVTLHKVVAKNIGAKVAHICTRGAGLRLEVGDISYADFDQEAGGARALMDIVRLLLKTILKSVLATVLGKRVARGMVGAVNGASNELSGAIRRSACAVQESAHGVLGVGHSSAVALLDDADADPPTRSVPLCWPGLRLVLEPRRRQKGQATSCWTWLLGAPPPAALAPGAAAGDAAAGRRPGIRSAVAVGGAAARGAATLGTACASSVRGAAHEAAGALGAETRAAGRLVVNGTGTVSRAIRSGAVRVREGTRGARNAEAAASPEHLSD